MPTQTSSTSSNDSSTSTSFNVLAPICLDFIESLKREAKGKRWVIHPLVVSPDAKPHHGCLLPFKSPPHCTSPVEFYRDNPPLHNCTFIKIKIPGKPLRLIGLDLKPPHELFKKADLSKPTLYISLWRANGWACRDDRIKRTFRKMPGEDTPDGFENLIAFRIHQASKPSKKKKKVIHYHTIDLSSPESFTAMAVLMILLIEKSFKWRGRKSETFDYSEPYYIVDLDGFNYECDEWHL